MSEASPSAGLSSAYAHCESLLREHDKDHFLADLFIPAALRPHAMALHAFALEIAQVRGRISMPMPGELRHQWWRDALAGRARGEASANPIAAAVIDTLDRRELPREALLALIDARGFDLYDEPMPDMQALRTYCEATSSGLFRLIATMLDRSASSDTDLQPLPPHETRIDEAARAAGLACAYTDLISSFAQHAARGQLYLPDELLQRHGSSSEEALSGRATPALIAALRDWRAEARRHLEVARLAVGSLPERAKPAFRQLALVAPSLRSAERAAPEPFLAPSELPQWRKQWALWRG